MTSLGRPAGALLVVVLLLVSSAQGALAADGTPPASPRAKCRPGDRPEPSIQGRVPGGKSGSGFTCNTRLLSHAGRSGGFKVERFVDKAAHECAYFDNTLVFPINVINVLDQPTGVTVLDMSNPAKPVRTATLSTPAMLSPHESLLVNRRRGLLVAVAGNPTTYPGIVDVYDLNDDCRHPKLESTSPVGIFGHESGFAPDGNTYYATSLFNGSVIAVDLRNPRLPVPIPVGTYRSHGLTISDDGNRAYLASLFGLEILDVSEIQARVSNPKARKLSGLTWPSQTIPQVAHPVTIRGRRYLVEVDEFSTDGNGSVIPVTNGPTVGAGRIIDIQDERHPRVVSNFRLAVNQPEHRAELAGDAGNRQPAQGYAAHYCNVPKRNEPGIVACSFIASGLRVFDIRDPYKPKELAYFVAPEGPPAAAADGPSNYAMSSPAFVPERGEIWYSDGNTGFYAIRVAKGVWPFPATALARLRLSVSPRVVEVGRTTRFSFRVTTAGGRALSGATVSFAGSRARTDRRGRVSIVKRFDSTGARSGRATKAGYRAATATVIVVRRGGCLGIPGRRGGGGGGGGCRRG